MLANKRILANKHINMLINQNLRYMYIAVGDVSHFDYKVEKCISCIGGNMLERAEALRVLIRKKCTFLYQLSNKSHCRKQEMVDEYPLSASVINLKKCKNALMDLMVSLRTRTCKKKV